MHQYLNQWDRALLEARRSPPVDGSIWKHLRVAVPQADERLLIQWLADAHGVSVLPSASSDTGAGAIRKKLRSLQFPHVCLTFGDRGHLLCEDPWSPAVSSALRRNISESWALVLALPGQLAALAADPTEPPANPGNQHKLPAQAEPIDCSVVDFVNGAIQQAYQDGASDIHFETDRLGVAVKYRLDGVMASGARLRDQSRAEEVLSRIKVLAQLDITERRRPQDGRIHWSVGKSALDLRVSIMPSIFGEDAVLRLLDKAQLRHGAQAISLDTLGFSADRAEKLRALAARPHGMLLMTGPTGSGKTTTVYAALSEVNDGLEKIITIEDPVEYELPGVLQIPVNEQKGLTFSTGLRSILRHDPDKILVGEIRDAETAEIAVQSSLTGHLVFTTVHANSLFDVIARFQHFGIEPFAFASALNGIVVQRLLRRVCPYCVQWRDLKDDERKKLQALALTVPPRVRDAVGCNLCRETGYKGRFVVAEIHAVSDNMRDLVVNTASMAELKKEVYMDPDQRLLAQAIRHVETGATTLEEVNRVVGLY